MIAKKMEGLVKGSSVIRAMFEEGKNMAKKYGAENVYDFSLGNPSVAPPEDVKRAFVEEVENEEPTFLHGYMSNTGYDDVRAAIAEHINELHGTKFDGGNIIMTVGAAGGLNVVLRSLVDPDDEVMVIAPYFGEYDNYVANANGKVVVVAPNPPSFQPNLDEFEEKITARTKVVIINTPNNPTGVVYSKDTLKKMGEILEAKGKEFGTDIYLLSDEPYRELVYDGVEVPYVTKYYANTIVGYSYSKSLSLPGERIGYLVIPSEVADFESVYAACGVATRILGFVNAPSLQQRVIMKSVKSSVDVSIYEKNRNLLLDHLKKLGFEVATPSGAFYLFVKCLEEDDKAFANKAKEENILVVPGSTFGCKGYVRIAYCVDYKMIERALPAFERLAAKYK